jgi:hypothetical protein
MTKDTRVLRHRIGSMPLRAEMAMADALSARRLRHAARCNCGRGKASAGCSAGRTYALSVEVSVASTLEEHAADARRRMNQYRLNRTWVFGGGRQHTYDHKCTG